MHNSQRLNVLLITSFHRSGSSMVGKILSNSGLFVGENLIQGAYSNPDGHYEDFEIVQAQENILTKGGSSWQFDGSKPLFVDEEDINRLAGLVASRCQNHSLWGFKDPRSCLFLEDWAKILGETGNYLFLYRHYHQCIASLYRRHSRIICIDQIGKDNLHKIAHHLNFWADGNLASRMWIAYNRRLLNF